MRLRSPVVIERYYNYRSEREIEMLKRRVKALEEWRKELDA